MKPILIAIALLVIFSSAKAQQTETSAGDSNKIFTAVEKDPSYKGGLDKFYAYLQKYTQYPAEAYKKKLEGKVFVTFVVEGDGSLSQIKILRGVSPDIDAEAIRVMKNSPNWSPGIQNGRPVRVQFTVLINFKLPPPELQSHLTDSMTNVPFEKKIFTAVEKDPRFPGGIDGFYKFLTQNLKYPTEARQNNIQGKVFLTFVVERDGNLSDIKVVRSLSSETDAEALRLVKSPPKWEPGMQNGVAVRVQYTMPVNFSLAN